MFCVALANVRLCWRYGEFGRNCPPPPSSLLLSVNVSAADGNAPPAQMSLVFTRQLDIYVPAAGNPTTFPIVRYGAVNPHRPHHLLFLTVQPCAFVAAGVPVPPVSDDLESFCSMSTTAFDSEPSFAVLLCLAGVSLLAHVWTWRKLGRLQRELK